MPGIITSGGPSPRSKIMSLVPQRLPRLQRMRDALLRLTLPAQAQERLALQIQELLFGQRPWRAHIAARQHPRKFPPDERVVVAQPAGAPAEVDAELERRQQAFAADPNALARLRLDVLTRP